ncbi:MAG: hypothetical protein ACR2JY_15060 [Chloroflexota bacterium]
MAGETEVAVLVVTEPVVAASDVVVTLAVPARLLDDIVATEGVAPLLLVVEAELTVTAPPLEAVDVAAVEPVAEPVPTAALPVALQPASRSNDVSAPTRARRYGPIRRLLRIRITYDGSE